MRATVRDESAAAFLRTLPGAGSGLTLVPNVDLLTQSAGLDDALSGCDAVLHTASPFRMGGTFDEMVPPALDGTRHVLAACARLGVRDVVLTSSIMAVATTFGRLPASHVFSEEDWSDEDLLRERGAFYPLAKVLAEKAAWEAARKPDSPIRLATLAPTLILGPMLPGQPHLNTSTALVRGYLDGSMSQIPNGCLSCVDVRDVAEAHVHLLDPAHKGGWGRRILLVGATPSHTEVATCVRDTVPDEQTHLVPTELGASPPPFIGAAPPNRTLYDTTPSRELLGVGYRSLEEMVGSSVDALLRRGS